MELVGAVKFDDKVYLFESDFENFVLDLCARLDDPSVRDGLGVVDWNNAGAYLDYMKPYSVDIDDLQSDYASLPIAEKETAWPEFLPTIFIDLDKQLFLSSHPEDHYLNFQDYLPKGWTFQFLEDFKDLIVRVPFEQQYWRNWKPGFAGDMTDR